ncbi:S1 family peptidase [uncultured Agrococcus sp.]|uniref:S1 family peptidase n=1 Tax=uncultured Agrococcus sp. TaxID=382258 RepID=UPI0025F2C2E1|nr:S1 family peptidase [uncultured Agrococcus sp.]
MRSTKKLIVFGASGLLIIGTFQGVPITEAVAAEDHYGSITSDESFEASGATDYAADSYQDEFGAPAEVAQAAIIDQERLIDLVHDEEIELGVDADVWVQSQEDGQAIHVRTSDQEIVQAFEGFEFEASEVVFEASNADIQLMNFDDDAVESAILEVSPGLQGFYVAVEDGALVIDTSDVLSDAEIDRIRDSTGYAAVEVQHSPEEAGNMLTARGGAAMSSCTSGFAARSGNLNGFFTAAHCRNSVQRLYSGRTTGSTSVPATLRSYVHNANADIGFYSVPGGNSVSRIIYASNTTTHTVTSARSIPTGVQACSRGKVSGWRCATVTSVNYRPTWGDACPGTCNAAFIRANTGGAPGDSGGPLVVGNSAVGILQGGTASWLSYSSIGYIPSGTSLVLS